VGQPITLIEPGITRETVEERHRLLAEGKPMYMRHWRKDGSAFDVESWRGGPESGARDVVLAVERDITERKRTEEALRESEARFGQLAEQSGIIAWEVDSQGLYTYVSRVSEAVWVTTRTSWRAGCTFTICIPNQDARRSRRPPSRSSSARNRSGT